MTKREQLLGVYQHKNIGYVPCFFTDFDFSKPNWEKVGISQGLSDILLEGLKEG